MTIMLDSEATVASVTPAFVLPECSNVKSPPFMMTAVRGKGSETGPVVVALQVVVALSTVRHGGPGVCAYAGFEQANTIAPASATKPVSLQIIGSLPALMPCESARMPPP